MGKVINIAGITEKLQKELVKTRKCLGPLLLASVQAKETSDANIYIKHQKKTAEKLGIDFRLCRLPEGAGEKKAVRQIDKLNKDSNVSGIIINKPFPENWRPEKIFSAVAPEKDIEGVSACSLGRMFYGRSSFISPTVLAVLKIIETLDIRLYGKDITVVGFSNLIGKPLALLLGQELATVSLTHIATYEKNKLPLYIKNSDILISAVGRPHFIKGEWIKEGAVVIDVGISKKGSQVLGDVEFEPARKKASYISPVPGGVGRLTPLFLFKNLLRRREK